jgi:hypothetical protein
MSSAANVLAGAQAAVDKAKATTKSVEGSETSRFGPQHAYSAAPYKMATAEKKKPTWSDQISGAGAGSDVASGIKARQQNEKDYNDATK